MVRGRLALGGDFKTLHGIVLCGKKRVMHSGYCGKGGQSVPVSDGAPLGAPARCGGGGGSGVD